MELEPKKDYDHLAKMGEDRDGEISREDGAGQRAVDTILGKEAVAQEAQQSQLRGHYQNTPWDGSKKSTLSRYDRRYPRPRNGKTEGKQEDCHDIHQVSCQLFSARAPQTGWEDR